MQPWADYGILGVMIDWDDIGRQLSAMTLAEIETLEREDYQAFLDRVTPGMTPAEVTTAYETFATILKATHDRKVKRLQSA